MNYMARGPHCWGFGKTPEEAVANAKVHFPRIYYPKIKRVRKEHFSIYASEGEFTIEDAFGRITSTAPITQIQKSILAAD